MILRACTAALLMFSPRSPGWARARFLHLEREPECQWCGSREYLQVHHVVPCHVDRDRELDPDNLISLCMGPLECHYAQGHRGKSWMAYDPDVRAKCEAHRKGAA